MKKLINVMLIVVILAAFTIPGLTDDKCCNSKKSEMKMKHCGSKGNCCEKLKKELNLTDKQLNQLDKMKKECMAAQEKLCAKIEELGKKKCALMCADKLDKKAVFKIIDELAKLKVEKQKNCVDCMLKVHSLLTPEQQKKMKELKAKCKTQAKERCKSKGHKGHHGHSKKEACSHSGC
jgi:Spy/CpxP family protein refolding chaperone